jgi:hypothetical protein
MQDMNNNGVEKVMFLQQSNKGKGKALLLQA